MAAARKPITRQDALSWRERWSQADRNRLDQEFDRLGVVGWYLPSSEQYIGCFNDNGMTVMEVHPSYVHFKGDTAPDDVRRSHYRDLLLSTYSRPSAPSASQREGTGTCPIHGVRLPVTGQCDYGA